MVLTKHRLSFLANLTVTEKFFRRGFAVGCSMANCDATCCRHGVYADLGERENILAHAAMIRRHLEPGQEHDPARWFEDEVIDDPDYPSGKAVGTRATENGCVFLDQAGRCTLQKAAVAEGMNRFALKPFYCVAYPVVIEHGILQLDDSQHVNRPQCCMITDTPALDAFDVCSAELEFVLGKEGLEELRSLAEHEALPKQET
jgi:Fe-S-cluster containining protein